jgi:hypothetical protein
VQQTMALQHAGDQVFKWSHWRPGANLLGVERRAAKLCSLTGRCSGPEAFPPSAFCARMLAARVATVVDVQHAPMEASQG